MEIGKGRMLGICCCLDEFVYLYVGINDNWVVFCYEIFKCCRKWKLIKFLGGSIF